MHVRNCMHSFSHGMKVTQIGDIPESKLVNVTKRDFQKQHCQFHEKPLDDQFMKY